MFLLYLKQLNIALYSCQKVDLNVYIQLIFLCVVNIIFIFSGIVLSTLVIVSFWKSSQLRKKLCHFMIVVLSCFDLVTVVTIYPGILLYLITWLKEDYDLLPKIKIYLLFTSVFIAFSFLVLLVMNIERYLGVCYPIFHCTSITKPRILTPLAIPIPTAAMHMIYRNSLVISTAVFLTIFAVLVFPPFMFVNFKLFTIVQKLYRERIVSPKERKAINFKNIFTGLWAVVFLTLLSVPNGFYFGFNFVEKSANIIRLSYIWAFTCNTMNYTLNSLIFFWKNKILRTEGIKILKTLKDHLVIS